MNKENGLATPCVKTILDYGEKLESFDYYNLMYVAGRRDDSSGKVNFKKDAFAFGKILNVVLKKYDEMMGKEDEYEFHIIPFDNAEIKNVVTIPAKKYGKAAMIPYLIQGGIYFCGKQGNAKKASFIVNLIMEKHLLKEEYVHQNGLHGKRYYFAEEQGWQNGGEIIDAKNKLVLGNRKMEKSEVCKSMYNLIEFLGVKGLMMSIFIVYALMHTIFAESGFVLNRILVLSGSGADSIARLLQIYNIKEDMSISLKNNVATIKRKIFECKDCGAIFKGGGEKVEMLKSIYCGNDCPEISVSGNRFKVMPKSLCVLISNETGERLDKNDFYKLYFDDNQALRELDLYVFSWFIGYVAEVFMKIYREDAFDGLLNRNLLKASEWFDENKKACELAMFLTVYDILEKYFKEFGFETRDKFSNACPEEYFSDFIDGEEGYVDEGLRRKIRTGLIACIKSCKNVVRYEKRGQEIAIPEGELIIMYDEEKVYIRGEQYDEFIRPNMPENISKAQMLMAMIKESEREYNEGKRCRISVKIVGNKSKRSDWDMFLRKNLEDPFALPIFEDKAQKADIKKKIFLGYDIASKVYLPLDSKSSNNRHIGILGNSGTGKSYTTLRISKELVNAEIPVVIVDCAESFKKETLNPDFVDAVGDKLTYISAYMEKIPLNIFAKQIFTVSGEEKMEKPAEVAQRCAQIIGRACGLSQMQSNEVYLAVKRLCECDKESPITLKELCEELRVAENDAAKKASAKLSLIADSEIFSETGASFNWKNMLAKGTVIIISLSGYENEMLKKMATESIWQDLWYYAKRNGREDRPFAVVADEIGLTPPKNGSAIANMLTLGRKYGVMCIWNTQFLREKFSDEEISNLNQSSLMLYFATTDVKERKHISECLAKYDGAMGYFDSLTKGTCMARGNFCTGNNALYKDKLIKLIIPKI